MGRQERRLAKLRQAPNDFTWDELVAVLSHLGFKKLASGGGAKFVHEESRTKIFLHPPHPGNEVQAVYLKQVVEKLIEAGLIEE